jgi:ABC-type transport system involved in multi-copper enzyme maturation permease subunit
LIWALIRKDARLLRLYLRSALVATAGCYVIMAVLTVIFSSYQEESAQSLSNRAFLTCMGGSNGGLGITYFFAALLAGSIFTLERSDRSAEFLACLPPTRMQNLISKLTVVLGVTAMMVTVHLLFALSAKLLLPFVRGQSLIHSEERLNTGLNALNFVGVIVSVVGGAFAVSPWLKSNGVPILCGLLTPALVASAVSLIGWALDIPSEGDAFLIRYATSSFVLGVAFGVMGCYWYLTGSEP